MAHFSEKEASLQQIKNLLVQIIGTTNFSDSFGVLYDLCTSLKWALTITKFIFRNLNHYLIIIMSKARPAQRLHSLFIKTVYKQAFTTESFHRKHQIQCK